MKSLEEMKIHVENFHRWINDTFTEKQIKTGNIDDAGYPHWNEIEDDFKRVFSQDNFESFNEDDFENLIFLIARQWDVGVILNWFNKGTNELSQAGMNEAQLFILARAGLKSKEEEARYQFAASLFKLGDKPEVISLLLKYLRDEASYTRRMALVSLSKLDYYDIETKIKELWERGSEWERITCLSLAEKHSQVLLKELILDGEKYNAEYLIDYIKKLKLKLHE